METNQYQKIVAKELNAIWFYYTKQQKLNHIKHLLTNCKKYIVHEVNKLIVFNWKDYCQVINTESNTLKYFDSEEEALNYCLDAFKNSESSKQEKLF